MRSRTLPAIHRLPLLVLFTALALVAAPRPAAGDDPAAVKETAIDGPGDVKFKVRMEGPYTADVPLQVVCYFRYSKERDRKLTGAPVELDKRLGGVIAALRERGEFAGDDLETVLLTPPDGTIKAKGLLLIGLGDEKDLSLAKMERVGRTALREAARLGATAVAFAPLIKDAGNDALPAGDTETAIVRGVLLAYDTEKRLRTEGLAKAYTLAEWWVEAGPKYYDETVAGVKKGIAAAEAAVKARPAAPYSKTEK